MSKDGTTLKYEAQLDRGDAAAYMEALAQALRGGELTIESGNRSLTVALGPALRFELEAEHDEGKGTTSVEIELTWNGGQKVGVPTLTILSKTTAEDEDELESQDARTSEERRPPIILSGQESWAG